MVKAQNYISLPHCIEAFQFTGDKVKPPQWFIDAVHIGKASVTINDKDQYVTIISKNQMEKAFLKDWVCLSNHGKIFVLDSKSFSKSFRKTD